MGLNFEFATAPRIIFGNHSSENVPDLLSGMGNKVLVVTGKNSSRFESLLNKISEKVPQVLFYHVPSEPTVETINNGLILARKRGCEFAVGLGGGSVIDTAKAIAALVPNKGNLLDYLEVIGKGKPLVKDPLPCVAVPTTSGTGSEVTKNSVIHSPEHRVKVSLRSPLMVPDLVVVDPILTHSMSRELTASSGVDALTHLLETFVSNQSNSYIDIFCAHGMKLIADSLLKAFTDGNDTEARENMSLASLLGGMALANVKLGAVHGFAGPIGGMFPIPHGVVCAALLPAVVELNIRKIQRQGLANQLFKFDQLAHLLTGDKESNANEAIDWIRNLIGELKIPPLSEFGITENHFPELIDKAKNASSMKGNPVQLSSNEMMEILEKSLWLKTHSG